MSQYQDPYSENDVYLWAGEVAKRPCVRSIWLAGSRAEGTARPDSDWDIIILLDDDVTKEQVSDEFLLDGFAAFLGGIDAYFLTKHALTRIEFNVETGEVGRVALTLLPKGGLVTCQKKPMYRRTIQE